MKFLLDTDTFSELAQQKSAGLAEHVARHPVADLAVSAITVGEILFGLAWATTLPKIVVARTRALLADITCLPVDAEVANRYAGLRAHLRKKGTPIGPNDHWIAAQALAADLTLITGNEREFRRVPGLRIENWLR
jgi:tRNA(fMet)-specific endonuclease VapC